MSHPRNYECFQFGTLRAHVEVNHARGKDVHVSRARAHFYVYCNKRGSLWNYIDWCLEDIQRCTRCWDDLEWMSFRMDVLAPAMFTRWLVEGGLPLAAGVWLAGPHPHGQ